MAILELLAPLFLLILLGALLNRIQLMPADLIGGVNRLIYWVGLPVVVFHSLVTAPPEAGDAGLLLVVLISATLVSIALTAVWAWLLRLPVSDRGTFIQGAFRGNLSFIGLPLLLTVPGVPRAPAVLAMAPMLILYNAAAVTVLLASRHQAGWKMLGPVVREIARNPIILASVAGALWHFTGWSSPRLLEGTLRAISQMTLPLALLCIGAALMTVPVRGRRGIALAAAVHKVALSPLIGYGIARAVGLDGGALLAALLYLTCPTAAVSYTMVKQIGGDEGLAASTVVISCLLSAPALALILWRFG